jgi:hypothetical protein
LSVETIHGRNARHQDCAYPNECHRQIPRFARLDHEELSSTIWPPSLMQKPAVPGRT